MEGCVCGWGGIGVVGRENVAGGGEVLMGLCDGNLYEWEESRGLY